LLIALDAVPVARACTNAALHLVGGALDANGVLGGPQALASLLLHPVSLFAVEADGIRNDAAMLHGLPPGHGEAFATGAAERAARTAVLLTGRGTGPAASAPSLPLFLVSDLLPANAPDANTEAALQRAGLERDGGTSRFRANGRRGREHGRSAA
ncbi:MAG: hypothetical protein INR65_19445, partial [Gluconacetobacter diazotrophicus]|nr:hypothetical protein [Gluconacetobacter diazotrophicus]